ncbi:MAG TPA: choice-of-anchor P family protein [Actinomycetota bacterium]|nr:choice-of-anchor P family protein [Actinomycetota bacterium]
MTARFRTVVVATLTAATLTALLFGSAARAEQICVLGPAGKPVCIDVEGQFNPLCKEGRPTHGETGQEGGDPLCPNGQAECIAYGMYLRVDPTTGLPGGATSHLARSHAQAQAGAWNGWGYGSAASDASTQRADVPGALGEGVVESSCRAFSYGHGQGFAQNYAAGTADAARLNLNLTSYGVPVTVSTSVLHEEGNASTGFVGYNTADIATVTIASPWFPAINVPLAAAPNTAIPLPGGLGTLYLNEQFAGISPWGCATFAGDALRLVVNRPGIGGQITLIMSWVANAAC